MILLIVANFLWQIVSAPFKSQPINVSTKTVTVIKTATPVITNVIIVEKSVVAKVESDNKFIVRKSEDIHDNFSFFLPRYLQDAKKTKIETDYRYTMQVINYCQVLALTYQDIFVLTKTYYTGENEVNTAADFFWKQDQWFLGFAAANLANLGVVSLLNQMDKSGIAGNSYLTAVNIAEVFAISSWGRYGPSIKIHMTVFAMTF